MKPKKDNFRRLISENKVMVVVAVVVIFVFTVFFLLPFLSVGDVSYDSNNPKTEEKESFALGLLDEFGNLIGKEEEEPTIPPLDKELYDLKLIELANYPKPKEEAPVTDTVTGESGNTLEAPAQDEKPKPVHLWPVKTEYPGDGAILPFERIVAYYGNLYSKKMGVLGEYPEEEMLEMLNEQAKKWEEADPETPVKKALHYIAVVAQGDAGKDGMYRLRMPYAQIDKIIEMARREDAIVFLDIQVGLSDIRSELPYFKKYLEMPDVHLGVDPEFYMKTGKKPGSVIGTMDAEDINYAVEYLANIVKEQGITPKVLVIHRFTQKMVTNYKNIKTNPDVQIVMNMDGWGGKPNKISTYKSFVYKEPVQFTGFKIFYKNDTKVPGSVIFEPEELLELTPRPIYIQYQ